MNYLVKTCGRTGSHFIMKWLAENQNCVPFFTNPAFKHPYTNDHPYIAIHDHYDYIPAFPENYILILSKRKNKFEQVLSHLIADKTKSFINYNDLNLEKSIYIDINNIIEKYEKNKFTENKWDLYIRKIFNWRKIYEIYQEDLSDDLLKNRCRYNEFKNFNNTLNIQRSLIDKSLFVSNYNELKEKFLTYLEKENGN